jgi:hypothetical protein
MYEDLCGSLYAADAGVGKGILIRGFMDMGWQFEKVANAINAKVSLTIGLICHKNIVSQTITRRITNSKSLQFHFLSPLSAPLGKPSAANPQVG